MESSGRGKGKDRRLRPVSPAKGLSGKGDCMGGGPPWGGSILSYTLGAPARDPIWKDGWRADGTNGKTTGRAHLGGAPERSLAPETGADGGC